jgi:hypothetical protein
MSPQSVALHDVSVAQSRHKSDGIPAIEPRQTGAKSLIEANFFRKLERSCGKRDNLVLPPEWSGQRRKAQAKSAVAMTEEEERALREQLARLLQEHRDLDAAIEALVTSPGSDLIQVQRLKKRKLVLRDKIRRIEDQLTPDIIA